MKNTVLIGDINNTYSQKVKVEEQGGIGTHFPYPFVAKNLSKRLASSLPNSYDKENHESTQELKTFLSIITHEIRTPINAILNATNFVCEDISAKAAIKNKTGLPDGEVVEALEILESSSERLSTFVSNLNYLVFLDDSLKTKPAFIFLQDIANRIDTLFQAINKGKPYRLQIDCLGGDLCLLIEEKLFYQTLFLMLLNITKTISAATILLKIECQENYSSKKKYDGITNTKPAEIKIHLSVDNGKTECNRETYHMLIAKNVHKLGGRLYYGNDHGKFQITIAIDVSLYPSFTPKIDLSDGLSLINKADTPVTSTPLLADNNCETRFLLANTNTTTAASREYHEKECHRKVRNNSILVIDDEEIGLRMVEIILKQANLSCLKAKSGKQAIEVFKAQRDKVKIVLMDIMLPDTNGYSLFKSFKAYCPTLPIVAFSAENSPEEISKMVRHGFYNYLPKPFKKEELLEIVKICQPSTAI